MARREWDKDLYREFSIVLSPSQLASFFDCPRKWWFKSVRRMPELRDQSKFNFGNVLHEVIQRWLEADDTGRSVETGLPVQLYPEGWTKDEDGIELVDAEEAALIQALVARGIEDGTLRRVPGRRIEQEVQHEIVPGKVAMVQFLDVASREGVEDHKSTKSTRYVASQRELADDPKMLCHAKAWLDTQEAAPSTVTLRLNYFGKDPMAPFTKPVTVEVPADDVVRFWDERVVKAGERMLELKDLRLGDEDWAKVAGPQSPGICKKYGGCPYAAICSRTKHPTKHREEINLANANKKIQTTTEPKPKPMSIFAKKPASPAPAPAPAPTPAATAVQAPAREVPPWTVEGCRACKDSPHGPGINKNGQPCGACNGIRKRQGLPTSDNYELWEENGVIQWAEKELPEDAEAVTKVEAPVAPVVSKPAKPAAAKKPEPKPVPAPVAAEPEPELEVEDVVAEQPAPAPAKPKRERKQKAAQAMIAAPKAEETVQLAQELEQALETAGEGFVLYINAIPLDEMFVDLSDILAREGAELAAAKGADSFYAMHAFERRDMLAQAAPQIAAAFAGQNVVAMNNSPDLDHFLAALKPFALRTIRGV